MRQMKRLIPKIVTAFWALLVSFPVFSMVLLPTSLEDLAKRADLVFDGVCESKRDGVVMHPNTKKEIPVTIYTFRIKELIKGEVGSTIEIKQWNIPRNAARSYGLFFAEASHFTVGQEYLLFWGPSYTKYPGMRSILSSNQGQFNVLYDSKGVAKVVNPYGNRGLFKGVAVKSVSKSEQNVLQAPPGPVPYDDFTSLIKKMVKE